MYDIDENSVRTVTRATLETAMMMWRDHLASAIIDVSGNDWDASGDVYIMTGRQHLNHWDESGEWVRLQWEDIDFPLVDGVGFDPVKHDLYIALENMAEKWPVGEYGHYFDGGDDDYCCCDCGRDQCNPFIHIRCTKGCW